MPREKITESERKRGADLGKALQKERVAKKRSQSQVADGANVSLDNLRRIEQGHVANPGVFTVSALSDALDKPLTHFVKPRKRQSP